ncbi:Tn3 family transposase [Methylobacter tundripaludum]
MSRVLKKLQNDGVLINQEILSSLGPYRLEHINRFGDYTCSTSNGRLNY